MRAMRVHELGAPLVLDEIVRPAPGPGQALIRMKASTICGSDIRAIYREHLGKGPEAYQGVVAGHEPCGQIERLGPDRVSLTIGADLLHPLVGGRASAGQRSRTRARSAPKRAPPTAS